LTTPASPPVAAESLARILLMQGMVGQLPTDDSVFGFVARGLRDIPGVREARHVAAEAVAAAREGLREDKVVLPIEIARRSHGAFVLTLADRPAFAAYEAFLHNLCFAIAGFLEERRQRTLNAEHQRELERRVEERTKELAEEVAVRRETERRAVAERERAERYLSVAEAVIVELDADGRIEVVNPRGCQLLGRTEAELRGCSWFEVAIPEEARAAATSVFRDVIAGASEPVEYYDDEIVDRCGRRYDVAWHNVARRDEAGRVVGTLGSGLDITARKAAESALAAEKERLAVTLRSIGDGVVTTDVRGDVVLMNAVAERLTGWTQIEAAGRPLSTCFNIIHEQTRAPHENPVERVLATRGVVELENHTVLVARDGTEYVIADSGAPILDTRDETIGVVLVFRDVTERHRLLDATQRTDRLESLGVLAGGIAHDFNNLLAGIYGYLELAKLDTREPAVVATLDEAGATLDRARGLTRQLLTFARGGSPVRRAGSLVPIVRQTAQFVLSGANVVGRFDLPEALWPCEFDATQIGQVVDNVVINAVQAMPLGGAVEISARNVSLRDAEIVPLAAGPYVQLRIRDQGIGIPPALLPKIFDPFFTTKQHGNGLGLATCYSIVRRHAGCIHVESEPGRGSTFTIYLPATPDATFAAVGAAPVVPRGSGTVLVMDDERSVLDVTSRMLTRLGYSVVAARDGQEAVALFAREREAGRTPIAVLLDLTVPGGMGGLEAGKAIRTLSPDVAIVVLSGYAHEPVMAEPERHGFSGSLSKPFTPSEMRSVLARVVRGADAPAPGEPR
jgi:PAS domain S-box-containing protein